MKGHYLLQVKANFAAYYSTRLRELLAQMGGNAYRIMTYHIIGYHGVRLSITYNYIAETAERRKKKSSTCLAANTMQKIC